LTNFSKIAEKKCIKTTHNSSNQGVEIVFISLTQGEKSWDNLKGRMRSVVNKAVIYIEKE